MIPLVVVTYSIAYGGGIADLAGEALSLGRALILQIGCLHAVGSCSILLWGFQRPLVFLTLLWETRIRDG
jgi:hypothetical protein